VALENVGDVTRKTKTGKASASQLSEIVNLSPNIQELIAHDIKKCYIAVL
jgi:hypothetical protein